MGGGLSQSYQRGMAVTERGSMMGERSHEKEENEIKIKNKKLIMY